MPRIKPRIENWSLVFRTEPDPYTAPELIHYSLHGQVYGHERFAEGETISTSYITSIDVEKQEVLTHSGTVYTLGVVDPEYEKIYPHARNRLFRAKEPIIVPIVKPIIEPIKMDEEYCGCCGEFHPVGYTGDCRDDHNRYPDPFGPCWADIYRKGSW